MKNSTRQSNPSQAEKRNLGFVKLRRGLKEHLHRSRMSSNASTLFVWLLLSAYHSGPKRGCVEVNYEDLMLGLGWYRKLVQRTIQELTRKNYIEVTHAANQHGLGTIKILKFDVEECDSAEDTGVPTKNSAKDIAEDSAQVEFVPTTVLSSTSISQNQQDLQAPKNAVEVKKEKNGESDAVRRPFDAELRTAGRKSFSPSEKRKRLEKRLEEKARKGGNIFDGDLDAYEIAAFAATQYKIRDRKCLTDGFVYVVWDVYSDHEDDDLSAGNLCSKVIDRCMAEQESCKESGEDPSEYFWPPDFQDHRDQLREKERSRERLHRTGAEVRA